MWVYFALFAFILFSVLFVWLFLRANAKYNKIVLSQFENEQNLKSEIASLKQTEAHLKESIQSLTDELHAERRLKEEQSEKRVQLETKLANAEQLLQNEKSLLEQAQDTFKSLASEVLEGSNKNFLELAKTTLEKQSIQSIGDLDHRKLAIEELVKPLKESLSQYQSQIIDIEKTREKMHGYLESELKKVSENHESLAVTTKALKDALKKPHIRGRWGEVQLKNCVDLAGMSEYSDVTFQDNTTLDNGDRLRPDMVVRMPGERKVIVDAKTPIEAFMASIEATTDKQKQIEIHRHGKHIKKHIQDLSTKDYAKNIKNSADFTVMFLPNESFLYAALEAEPDLMEYALQKKVLIATPPTLIGLLKVIRFGWNEQQLAENAQRISDAGKELHKRVCDFMDSYLAIGKHLNSAREQYDKGLTRLESRVLVQTKRLEKLGAKSTKSLSDELHIQDTEDTPRIEGPQV